MSQPIPQSAYLVANGTGTIYPTVVLNRDPTTNDLNGPNGQKFQVTQRWVNSVTDKEWFLLNFITSSGYYQANWVQIAGGSTTTETLTGNTGGAVGPTANNINVVGDGTTVDVVGDPATSTLTISLIGGGAAIEEFIPDSGTSPVVSNASGQVTMAGSGSITTVGGTNTLTTELTGLTNHAVLVGAGTTTITKVGPSSDTGAPLISGGAAADPSYSTTTTITDSIGLLQVQANVPNGGPQIVSTNTNNVTLATSRFVVSTNSVVANSDAYILYAGGAAFESGYQESTSSFVVQYAPANTHPYMDGITGFQMSSSGAITFPAVPGTSVPNQTLVTMDSSTGQIGNTLTPTVTSITFGSGTALSVYQEGTWTPTVVGQSVAGTTTYTIQNGYYTKVGNMVTVWANLQGSGATGTGAAIFGGLPFTVKNQTAYGPTGSVFSQSDAGWVWPAGTTMLTFDGLANSTTGVVQTSGTATSGGTLQMANAAFIFQYTMSYQV